MTNKLYLSVLSLAALLLLSSCGWIYQIGGAQSEFDATEAKLEVADFAYTNQNGEEVSLSDFEGDYWLADMIFTSCPTVCPIMTPNMRELQDMAIAENLDLSFVSFSIDPENDTVEHLKGYTENIGVNDAYWDFLTGYDLEEIQAFALDSFKAPVEKTEDDFLHSTRFFLIDGEGKVVRIYDGLASDLSDIKADIQRTVK
ncbi:SCO family protein [Shouchella clausii]|uniref:SCO family protein n=1 Tax=Shouchella clausii TaxID=79880 RepID=UPI001FE3C170|nr:SCO family protein [Shouchella clausii]MCY1105720.1 SCO family protein [Shouchella clausii]